MIPRTGRDDDGEMSLSAVRQPDTVHSALSHQHNSANQQRTTQNARN